MKKNNNKKKKMIGIVVDISYPFVPNAPFFYPLKTLENRKVF